MPSETTMPSTILECDKKRLLLDSFHFESDHEALRDNEDYRALLRHLVVLESQRMTAVRDHSVLVRARKEAFSHPMRFLQTVKSQEADWKTIRRQNVVGVEQIVDMHKYQDNKASSLDVCRGRVKMESHPSASSLDVSLNDSAPAISNNAWSADEQVRLEGLLIEYPSESVEMERWKKIAKALGTRTPLQVQSRTQKYFGKLLRAGLPIPGRICKRKFRSFKGSRKRTKKSRDDILKSSNFFPQWNQANFNMDSMSEEEGNDDLEMKEGREAILNDAYLLLEDDVSDEDDCDKASELYTQLMWTKRIRREKAYEEEKGPMVHEGFSCDGCGLKPIVGGRFQCIECRMPDTIDFCCDCAPKEIAIGEHNSKHQLRPVRKRESG